MWLILDDSFVEQLSVLIMLAVAEVPLQIPYEVLNRAVKCLSEYLTQQNSYSISHLLGTVTTQWLDSDGVVSVVNCRQHGDHGDYTVDQLCSHCADGSC